MNTTTELGLCQAFQHADDAWQEELVRNFGRDAGQARYERRGKGGPGSALRRLHEAFAAARDAYWASRR